MTGATRVVLAGPTAGRCLECGTLVWRSVPHPTESLTTIVLWPDPSTRYVRVKVPAGEIVGLCYCANCCPAVGAPCHSDTQLIRPDATVVVGVETAKERYAYWYTKTYGDWLKAWLSEELHLDEPECQRCVAQWDADSAQVRSERSHA